MSFCANSNARRGVPAATSAMKTIYQNMLKLDVAQPVPIHGHVGTNDEFVKIVTKTP